MNGMLFAAGLGTRLAPLTDYKPKALVEVDGKPLLRYALDHFCHEGVTTLVINVHHFASQIIDYVNGNAHLWPTMNILFSDETDELLDTGGGLVKASKLFAGEEPIIVGNADVLSNAPLAQYFEYHKVSGCEASLVVRSRESSRKLFFDVTGRFSGWRCRSGRVSHTIAPRNIWQCDEYAFCGFHIIKPSLIREMSQSGKFSIIDAYLSLAANHNIGRIILQGKYYWFDVGTPEKLAIAQDFIRAQNES